MSTYCLLGLYLKNFCLHCVCISSSPSFVSSDAILGECVEQIGDTELHPPTKRVYLESHGNRKDLYGHDNEFTFYDSNILEDLKIKGQGPLWFPHDIREESFMGNPVWKQDKWKSPTGYHFHNFFMSYEEIEFKYTTYGHANKKALGQPLRFIHEDLDMAVRCAHGKHAKKAEISFESIPSTARPIYYLDEEVRKARHSLWQDIVRKDDAKYGQSQSTANLRKRNEKL